MTDETHFRVRPADHGDIHGIAGLFQQAYQQSSHPCANPDHLAEGFRTGQKWLVCEFRDTLIGCTGLVPNRWNGTYEAGRSVTLPAFQKQKLGQKLWRHSIRWAVEFGDHDLLFGTPRSSAVCRMCGLSSPPLVLFGHDGGANVANGKREIHAVGLIRTNRSCQRAEPTFGPGIMPIFKERTAELCFHNVVSSPPQNLVIGPEGDHRYQTARGTGLHFSRMDTPLGWSILITSVECSAHAVEGLFASFLADHPEVRHVACYLLWDKLTHIGELARLGFQATAYLPGWHLLDGMRHDCILLTWLAPGETTVLNGMEDFLQPIQDALAGQTRVAAADI
jgi:GNAT superfamily N-acetyltransferase